jgi:hypothetical protein
MLCDPAVWQKRGIVADLIERLGIDVHRILCGRHRVGVAAELPKRIEPPGPALAGSSEISVRLRTCCKPDNVRSGSTNEPALAGGASGG